MNFNIMQMVYYVAAVVVIFAAEEIGYYVQIKWLHESALLLPAMGIGLAILWVGGYRYVLSILLGLLLAALSQPPGVIEGIMVLLAPIAKVAGLIVGVSLLRWLHFTGTFLSIRDVLVFHAVVIILGAATAVVITMVAFIQSETLTPLYAYFGSSWGAHVLSCLVLTPALLAWTTSERIITHPSWIEVAFAGALVVITDYLLFWTNSLPEYTLLFFTLFFLAHFWVCLRFSHRLVVVAITTSTILSVIGLLISASPRTTIIGELFALELFLLAAIPIFFAFSSLVKERAITIEQLQNAKEAIEQENINKNEFIAVLAHELRNPLALVKTTLEILEMEMPAAATKQHIASAHQHVHSMRRLLDDLLDITRVTQGKFKLQLEQVLLATVVDSAVEGTRALFAERRHQLVRQGTCEHETRLNVDPVRFEQVLVNLLTNAAKYTDPGGRVEIVCTVAGNVLTLQVIDNGQGIEPEHINHVFDSFWQKQTQTTHSGEGIGVGLALTKRIVELHRGTITAYSAGRNRGTTFTIQLPVITEFGQRAVITTALPRSEPRQFTILVVDDNEDAATALAKLLELKGHQTRAVYTAAELFAVLPAYTPEVILLDIGLPDKNGFEVARELRAQGYSGTLLALSGYGQKEDKDKAAAAGFDQHFTKPMSTSQLDEYLAHIP